MAQLHDSAGITVIIQGMVEAKKLLPICCLAHHHLVVIWMHVSTKKCTQLYKWGSVQVCQNVDLLAALPSWLSMTKSHSEPFSLNAHHWLQWSSIHYKPLGESGIMGTSWKCLTTESAGSLTVQKVDLDGLSCEICMPGSHCIKSGIKRLFCSHFVFFH